MTKYKEYVKKMIDGNKDAFEEFKRLHDNYALDEEKWQGEFNKEGEKIMKIVHEWENRLCMQSEKAGYGNYTGGLAEKFKEELKKTFPMVDYIGIVSKKEPTFFIRKISLK